MLLPHANPSNHAARSRSIRAHRRVVLAILFIAGFLRVAALDRYPLPIHQDELSDIYDGYSLATTGADRSGQRWPILVRGMGPGDYHPGAYAYLAAIPAFLAGFSVWAGRLPAALAGILTVWLVYLTTRRLFDDRVALVALLFAAFSPIHILYSRQAHQGVCLVPLCVVLIVYLLVRSTFARRDTGWRSVAGFAVAGLFIGLSTNAYAGQRVTAFLFAVTVLVAIGWTIGVRQRDARRAVGLIAAFSIAAGIGAAPQLWMLAVQPERFFARAGATVYPIHCGVQWWVERLLANLALNLDPHYLFFSFGDYALLSVTRLNLASMPFLSVGLIGIIVLAVHRRSIALAWVPLGVLFSLLPALITEGNPSSMRSSGVWALYPIVCAVGVVIVARMLRSLSRRVVGGPAAQGASLSRNNSSTFEKRKGSLVAQEQTFGPTPCPPEASEGIRNLVFESCAGRRHSLGPVVTTLVATLIVGAGAFDMARYLTRPDLQGRAAQHDFVRIGEWLASHGSDYERVYIDADGMFGYLYVAAFSGMTPEAFRRVPRRGTVRGLGWDEFERFGRYRFASEQTARAQWARSHTTRPWLVIDGDLRTVVLSGSHEAVTSAEGPTRFVP